MLQDMKERAKSELIQRLVEYIENQWMANITFDIHAWSVFGQHVRTHNNVEGVY